MNYVVNSGDSHVWEPKDLWTNGLPSKLVDRALTVTPDDRGYEVIAIDNKFMRRETPAMLNDTRPPGVYDPEPRLKDMDEQGVDHELLFPTVGLWLYMADDPELVYASARVYSEWVRDVFMARTPRFLGAAMVPLHDPALALKEAQWAADNGFKALGLPCQPPDGAPFNSDVYEDLWSFVEESGLRPCFHVGTGMNPVVERGPGAAIINYLETYAPAQRSLAQLIASGTLSKHPDLHITFVESGASWLAALVERLDEGMSQHGRFMRPQLPEKPGDIVRRQVHVTFQRDRAAMRSLDITGAESIMFGTDYPHLEGTWPNTQQVVAETFADVPEDVARAVTSGNFNSLFGLTPAVV